MYSIRLWSGRHSRFLERVYNAINPIIIVSLRGLTKVFGRRIDGVVTLVEASGKGIFFDCKMCGNCVLSKTGMVCPMNCPKQIRNGPCGGVRGDGTCEVDPTMRCVWVEAWNGADKTANRDAIHGVEFAVDHRKTGYSSWLHLARGE